MNGRRARASTDPYYNNVVLLFFFFGRRRIDLIELKRRDPLLLRRAVGVGVETTMRPSTSRNVHTGIAGCLYTRVFLFCPRLLLYTNIFLYVFFVFFFVLYSFSPRGRRRRLYYLAEIRLTTIEETGRNRHHTTVCSRTV